MGRKIFFPDDQQTPGAMNNSFNYGGKTLIFEKRIWNPYVAEIRPGAHIGDGWQRYRPVQF
ncbi:MAG: hypothetical protein L0220_32480 [Acidobacteria bacterium]|nr:hypothetical protein [Acidobacteriota bacterium]